jgi:hypothetical protein
VRVYDSRLGEIRFGAQAPEGFPLAPPPGGKAFGVFCEAQDDCVIVRVCYRVCGPAQPLLRRYVAQMRAAGLTVGLSELDGELCATGRQPSGRERWRVQIRPSGGGYELSMSVERAR